MPDTARLGLPLLAPAQAQKHVTVNEGMSRLDALVHLSLTTAGGGVPPASPVEGEVHAVGGGASGEWTGQDGALALFLNGGWTFLAPATGWQAWSEVAGTRVAFDGQGWIEGAGSLSANGAGFVHRTIELDHAIGTGATSIIPSFIPAGTIVYGITARVIAGIGGATSLEIGVSGAANRYGGGIGLGVGAWARGITGSPLAYYADTDLVIGAEGGSFDGSGSIRVALHLAELTLPRG